MITILQGDWIEQLRPLPDASVHCCVTSPPYWSLRDYGVAGQLGLEKTPEEYVAKLVEGFREVRRVLRDDATCWINLGDSYATSGPRGNGGWDGNNKNPDGTPRKTGDKWGGPTAVSGLKAKDLCGIPWRVAFALQADGWYLRSDIIWSKPNPMPESVTDRPTKAHEYIFLLSKSERYFFDSEAIKEPSIDPESLRPEGRNPRGDDKYAKAFLDENRNGYARTRDGFSKLAGVCYPTRNRRTVWTVPSQPYPESHFATFPEDLIKPCIMAGTSAKGCCPKCGAPWERVMNLTDRVNTRPGNPMKNDDSRNDSETRNKRYVSTYETTGWQPTCECYDGKWAAEFSGREGEPPLPGTLTPCTVLDPFGGSGTTGQVAMELGRKAILIELNPKYVELMKARTNVTPGLPLA